MSLREPVARHLAVHGASASPRLQIALRRTSGVDGALLTMERYGHVECIGHTPQAGRAKPARIWALTPAGRQWLESGCPAVQPVSGAAHGAQVRRQRFSVLIDCRGA